MVLFVMDKIGKWNSDVIGLTKSIVLILPQNKLLMFINFKINHPQAQA